MSSCQKMEKSWRRLFKQQENSKMKCCVKWFAASIMLLAAACVAAAPGTLANAPLTTPASVEHNLMFILDHSTSMNVISPDAPYNPNIIYLNNCPKKNTISTQGNPAFSWDIVKGKPEIEGDPWGTGKKQKCFENTWYDNVYLDQSINQTTGYDGNYLNWYFNAENDPQWVNRKPGTSTRKEIQQDVVKGMVDSLSKVRVGLSDLETIHVAIDDIAVNRTAIKNAIDNLGWLSYTPLAMILHKTIRYFRGETNDILTLHPGQSNEEKKFAAVVFDNPPEFAKGVNKNSPIQGFCQKNFIILMTDGWPYWDAISTSTGLNDYDGDCAKAPKCYSWDMKTPPTFFNTGDQMDDIAMAAYEMDLLPNMNDANGKPVKNNIVIYTIGFFINNALLHDAAVQGGGLFFNVNNSDELIKSFKDIFKNIAAIITNSAASIALNSGTLNANSKVFRVNYTSDVWTGDLLSNTINENAELGKNIWNAQTTTANIDPNERLMWTVNRDPTVKAPVLFKKIKDLSTTQQADLATAPNGSSDNLAQDRINYLRGDTTKESDPFRPRKNLLGDIIHTSPMFVGAVQGKVPTMTLSPTATADFAAFQKNAENRLEMIYVGNNNPGSLQAYNANTGELLMDYIPDILFSQQQQEGLHYLTDPNYSHRYYVDGTLSAQDAYTKISPNDGKPNWYTVLVGGLNAGGKGVYALNITDPKQFEAKSLNQIFLWEFSSKDHPDMGYSFGEPIIGLLNNGKYAAIIPNGFNNDGSGKAILYVLFLEGGLDGTWAEGTDYLVFNTQVGSSKNKNGAAVVGAADLTGNGAIDRVYMGDIQGNIWAIDLSSEKPADWQFAYNSGKTPAPLLSVGKPITGGLQITRNPNTSGEPNLSILFGTGQFLTEDDKIDTSTNYFFNVWDSGKSKLTMKNLLQQKYKNSSDEYRILEETTVSKNQNGCFIELPDAGERVITRPLIYSDLVFFNTMIPQENDGTTNNADICNPPAQSITWLMALDINSCGQPQYSLLDINDDDKVDDNDLVNSNRISGMKIDGGIFTQTIYRSGYLLTPTASGAINAIKLLFPPDSTGRISWQDLTPNPTHIDR
jgi:type IV pilus assembly protein PilY1